MLKQEVTRALEVVRNGGIILYPTDTVWGLGCDALNEEAVIRIMDIKHRQADKSFIILVDNAAKIAGYADVPDLAYDLIDFSENPLTVIYPGAKNLPVQLIGKDNTIGIRVCKHEFCTPLLQQLKRPLVSTSANLTGLKTPANFNEIAEEIKNSVDYIVDFEQHFTIERKPSTIMRLTTDGVFEFIRR